MTAAGEIGCGSRRARFLAAGVVLCLAMTFGVAAAAAQGPGLPRTYQPTIIDSPNPIGGGSFGWGVSSADLTGD